MSDNTAPGNDKLGLTCRGEEFLGEELHDTVCQTLAGTSLMISLLTRRLELGKELNPKDLEKVRSNVDAVSEQLRLIFEATLLERRPDRLLPMLERFAAATAKRVPCEFSADDSVRVSNGSAAYAFYRIARIFVHIAVRAGGATRIRMRLNKGKKATWLHLSFEGTSVLSRSFLSADEKILKEAMAFGSFEWRVDSGTQLQCGPR